MTRFLLALPESVELVQYAFEHAKQGDIFIKKAPACTVDDLAQALKNLFNSNVDTQIIGYREPTLVLADASVPDLPSEAVPYLVSEAKKHCLAKLKQVDVNDASYREEVIRNRRQGTWLQRKKWRTAPQSKIPNYGRS